MATSSKWSAVVLTKMGIYELNISQVVIKGHKAPLTCEYETFDDSVLFDKRYLFKIEISPEALALELK